MIVDIVEIERVLRYFKAINQENLEDIVWMRGSESLIPSAGQLEEFNFLGLSNRDFPSVIGWMPDDIGIRITAMTLTKRA
jgi:hypothetical protein